ncbi:NADH-quinone oxidoreductase subunit J [Methanolobus zinderi]|jgi:NADH-quinone oxidoreductase subunit J|uniref:NADH-quinone oxidoreductase subunit J n=1 Tax=Methanolobus zinderi TaxID=536044 RepID=A0A7D5I5R1_9EURY|nr:F420H2 dehydrogenase subunit FpoJ [Methanolobus zinderi]KXS42622.1 MAG: NADH:ubiquinone oxidoreductase subunit 6 (chain J) [Methanolobus sp. T82-4]QLC50543.1 NADH-quinone oxidoreductase subunit J [Methanolobus zinderi]
MMNKEITIKPMEILTSVYNFFRPRILGMTVAFLFLAVLMVSVFFTSWPSVDQIPQNLDDPSNIQGIGVMIFTDFVVPFEILSIVLLSSLMGAIYMAKGDGSQ